MKIISNRITAMVVLMATIFYFLVITAPLPLAAYTTPDVEFKDGLLSVKAEKALLVPLLEKIAGAADVDIYISEALKPGQMSIDFQDMPVELAFKKLLIGLSYASVYLKEGMAWKLTAIKIYSEGQTDSNLVALRKSRVLFDEVMQNAPTVVMKDMGQMQTYGGLGREGLLIPSRTRLKKTLNFNELHASDKPWFALQLQLERDEVRAYEKLMLYQKKIEAEQNQEKRADLCTELCRRSSKIYELKSKNLNKIESLKRISQAKQLNP